jgi:uncharacterized protein (DUF2236 family)
MDSLATTSPAVMRRIWGSTDALLLVTAGIAGELAVHKAVDWMLCTGKLLESPMDRLFDTVRFMQQIFFSDPEGSARAISELNCAHERIEAAQGAEIPQWAYRNVLGMVIDYGERAHSVVFGPMSRGERGAHFAAGLSLGRDMRITDLPASYTEYRAQRQRQLKEDYESSWATERLYDSYRRALGPFSYRFLLLLQCGVLPLEIGKMLGLEPNPMTDRFLRHYHCLPGGGNKLRPYHGILLPRRYTRQVQGLERQARSPIGGGGLKASARQL